MQNNFQIAIGLVFSYQDFTFFLRFRKKNVNVKKQKAILHLRFVYVYKNVKKIQKRKKTVNIKNVKKT